MTPTQKSRKIASERFLRVRNAGITFTRQLRHVARQIGMIIEGMAPGGLVEDYPALSAALNRYSQLLGPWAKNISLRMIAEINQRDEKAWITTGREIGRGLKGEIADLRQSGIIQDLAKLQVELITSLPTQASQRVHGLVIEGMSDGTRAADIAKEIRRTGQITESRAMLIARTEVARTASTLTQARAESIGSDSYIWRTSNDSDVRDLHKKLNGKIFRWDDPPINGENDSRGHPGTTFNCRCYAEPIIPDA